MFVPHQRHAWDLRRTKTLRTCHLVRQSSHTLRALHLRANMTHVFSLLMSWIAVYLLLYMRMNLSITDVYSFYNRRSCCLISTMILVVTYATTCLWLTSLIACRTLMLKFLCVCKHAFLCLVLYLTCWSQLWRLTWYRRILLCGFSSCARCSALMQDYKDQYQWCLCLVTPLSHASLLSASYSWLHQWSTYVFINRVKMKWGRPHAKALNVTWEWLTVIHTSCQMSVRVIWLDFIWVCIYLAASLARRQECSTLT